MSQLPRARSNKDSNLQHTIPNSLRIRVLTQVSEIHLPLPLVLLFPPNIFEFLVEVPELAAKFTNVGTVALNVWFHGPYDNVEIELDVRARPP
jgi:hypothetical protein